MVEMVTLAEMLGRELGCAIRELLAAVTRGGVRMPVRRRKRPRMGSRTQPTLS